MRSQQWTSSRIESKSSWTPADGKVTQIQASFRTGIGKEASKQGMWPAFWMLGESSRYGTRWPLCGEIDIFEQINGVNTGYGTVHGGISGDVEYDSQLAAIIIPDDDNFHTWSLKIDRTSGRWQDETLQWFMDGKEFNSLTGAAVNDQGIWSSLAWSPLYIIINLAVGGNWPGYPNGATQDGYNSMMEVQYVAIYETL
ncbi:concanavalin A-like lectin/glucanase domain-containing protein [Trichoderma velutinum]